MDFLTCPFILTIVLNNLIYSKWPKHCGNSTDFEKQTATPFVSSSSMSSSSQLKGCRGVLKDIYIFFSCGAAKLQILDLSLDKNNVTNSHHTTESDFFKNLRLNSPIVWGNSVNEQWTQQDDKVSDKLICVLP